MKKYLLNFVSLFCFHSLVAQDAVQIALDFLEDDRRNSKLSSLDIKDPLVTNNYVSKHNGVNHLYFQQQLEGIKIHDAISTINISKEKKVLSFGNRFISNSKNKINTKDATIGPLEAVEKAAQQLGIHYTQALSIKKSENNASKTTLIEKADLSTEDISVELAYLLINESELRLAWNILINTTDLKDIWSVQVDAQTGIILDRYNRVIKCKFGPEEHELGLCANKFHNTTAARNTKSTAKSVSSNAVSSAKYDYNVYPVPIESPNHGDRQIVNSPWLNHNDASPIGWHSDDGEEEFNTTRGNNTWTREDRDGNNTGGYSPESESFEFDYVLDFNQAPSQNQDPAITNLFYWTNMVHDVWYQYGFDEVSGNYQSNNFDKGGEDDDFVYADAQDGEGFNNANFAVTPDGTNGRLQMFEWNNPAGPQPTVSAKSESGTLGVYDYETAIFGPRVSAIQGNLVLVDDGTDQPTLACSPIINGDEVEGNIALIDRADCNYVDKVLHANEVGAIAVVMINNLPGDGAMGMGAPDDYTGGIDIPTISVSYENGNVIKDAIADGAIVSIDITPAINLDGDFDNGVIAHEYGHGISTRLCGGPANVGCLSGAEQMGEGWSDWIGLMMTMTPQHTRTSNRGYGTYLRGQGVNGSGIRPARYNTNFAVNDFTYDGSNIPDVAPGEPEVYQHTVGFIWATILWEMTWDLIDEYGFDSDLINGTGGNNIAMQLVIDGLKLQPCNPGMVDGRDAILLADQINNGGANQELLWNSFTIRGLGIDANQGTPNSHNDQSENFDLPPEYADVRMELIASSDSVNINENIGYTLRVENKKGETATDIEISVSIPENTVLDESSIDTDYELVGNALKINIANLDNNAVLEIPFELTSEHNSFSKVLFADGAEDGLGNWDFSNGSGDTDWVAVDDPNTGEKAWFAENLRVKSEQYLAQKESVTLEKNNDLILSFWHKYRTENTYDGGLVEFTTSDDDFTAFKDSEFIQNAYNNQITSGSSAQIAGRDAYSGVQYFYKQSIVNLNDYVDSDFKVRFNFSTSFGIGQDGWYVDDVKILDAVILNLNACMAVDGQENICLEHNAIVNKGEIACNISGGNLTPSVETEDGLFEKGLGQELIVDFSVDYENDAPDELYESAFIITKKNDDFTIIEIAESSTFDFTNYSLGRFIVWNLNYNILNDEGSIAKFIEKEKIESIQDIMDEAEDNGICLALSNQDANGNVMELRVALPSPPDNPDTGISDIGFIQNISIAPNPVSNELNLAFSVAEKAALQVKIFDVKGQLMKQVDADALPGDNILKIDINAFTAGAYLLSIDDGKGFNTLKFVKD